MAQGSDFVCINNNCECFEKCLSIHGPWPLAKIEDVLSSSAYKDNPQGMKSMQDRKKLGKEFACMKLPNADRLKTRGFRIQLYCEGCKMMWEEDIIGKSAEAKVEKLCRSPSPCPSCGKTRISNETSYRDGLKCPSCGVETKKCCWYTG